MIVPVFLQSDEQVELYRWALARRDREQPFTVHQVAEAMHLLEGGATCRIRTLVRRGLLRRLPHTHTYEAVLPGEGHRPALGILDEIADELQRARERFPEADGSMTALAEEVGELAKALLDESPHRIRAEAVQVAVMAIRVATEGDPTLNALRARRRALTE